MRLLPHNMTAQRSLFRVVGALTLLWPAAALAQTPADCRSNPDQARWFVRAGRSAEGAGTNDRPLASLAEVERCAPAGATITVLAPADGAPPLDGGIRLKDRQKLLGAAPAGGGKPAARLTNTGGTGDAVTLAHGNEVAHLHIENPAGGAIFGDNVNGTHLHDLLLTRRGTAPPTGVDPSLCRVVKAATAVDMSQSVLRGCNQQGGALLKSAVMLLVDDGVRVADVKYSLQRLVMQDNPIHERPQFLWRAGVQISAAGRISARLEIQESSVENALRGVSVRASDRSTITAQITDLRLDSLRDDGIAPSTGFTCSGLDNTFNTYGLDCAKLSPAPASDARVVLNIDRLRFTDTLRHGAPNSAGVIEPAALDQDRSTIEIHVQRSDITDAAAAGFFTFYIWGRPAKDMIDFGCVNPDPAGTSPDPAACRRAGYTSIGQNRIFGNSRTSKTHTPQGEIALQGPGAMMAQGNYFGDIAPTDGKGDALGECHQLIWPADNKSELPPVRLIPNARCELYSVAGQGNPAGIDARFHLASDPRPPK
jgi:hypothetical protein